MAARLSIFFGITIIDHKHLPKILYGREEGKRRDPPPALTQIPGSVREV